MGSILGHSFPKCEYLPLFKPRPYVTLLRNPCQRESLQPSPGKCSKHSTATNLSCLPTISSLHLNFPKEKKFSRSCMSTSDYGRSLLASFSPWSRGSFLFAHAMCSTHQVSPNTLRKPQTCWPFTVPPVNRHMDCIIHIYRITQLFELERTLRII